MQSTAPTAPQQIIPGMRLVLYLAGVLVAITGVQLFILTEYTDQFFAWTIQPPLTAAFLGAAYWSACALEFSAAREASWSRARIAVPAVLIFTGLTLVVTLLHLDRFHLARPEFMARSAAWAWLLVYALVPIALAALLALQLRAPGATPARTAPLPVWLSALMAVQGLVLLVIGALLLISPQTLLESWPWKLTPLTGRAIGAWAVGLGVAVAQALWENDLLRVRAMTLSSLCFGALVLIAVARYAGDMNWSSPAAPAFVVFIASILVAGLSGWLLTRRVKA